MEPSQRIASCSRLLTAGTRLLLLLCLLHQCGQGEKYRLTVKTGLRPFAGTNSKVKVILIGTTFRTKDHELDNSGDDFRPGSSTEYVFHDYAIGKVTKVQVCLASGWWFFNDDWYLRYIVVRVGSSEERWFSFYRWMGMDIWRAAT